MRADLQRVLYEALADSQVQYRSTVDAISEAAGGVQVRLSDGTNRQADLLVGADGIHSRIRELTFGHEEQFLRYLGYHTAAYLIDDKQLRQRVGTQFLVVAAPGRQVGLYPTNDGRLAVWLVHRSAEANLPDDTQAAVRVAYAGMGELADEALRRCPSGREVYYDLVAQIDMDSWSKGPVTLIGDACQAVSLMVGQGASLAVGGAYVLAQELRRTGSTGQAACRYEQRMRPYVQAKQKAGRRTAQWLVPSTKWGLTLRAAALSVTRIPGTAPLIRAAMRSVTDSVVEREART
jgi:2-polyprenyl-6-methoxyphenol hydroxylase-like FAD-dependent oxidoreductase